MILRKVRGADTPASHEGAGDCLASCSERTAENLGGSKEVELRFTSRFYEFGNISTFCR